MKHKVLFVLANTRWHDKRPWLHAPYSAMILTSILKEEFDFNILDANGLDLSEEDCQRRIKEHNPNVVLVSGLSIEYHKQYHTTFALVKSACPDAITVFGGIYPTLLSEEAVKDPSVDFVFMGHAEERIDKFLKLILSGDDKKLHDFSGIAFKGSDGKVKVNPVNSYISKVKKMARIDYSRMDYEHYVYSNGTADYLANPFVRSAAIITAYGCKYNCAFCASKAICGVGVAYRPIEDVLEEIDYLIEKYKVKSLIFYDELLLGKRERINKLLNVFISKNYNLVWKAASVSAWDLDDEILELMKKSGCEQITISVESGSERVLREIIHKPRLKLDMIKPIIKKCKELGIVIRSDFIFGFPGEKWDEIRATFRFADECDFDLASFHIANPMPGTELYRIAKEKNLLPKDFNFLDDKTLGYRQGFITTDEFTPRDLMILSSYEWDRINFRTPEKAKRAAEIYGITPEQLNEHRRRSRENLGLLF